MKAKVKIAYFDNSGLHKIGDVVEVDKLSNLVEPIVVKGEPEKPSKAEPTETEEKAKVVKKVKRNK